jgi:tripartite-type tricarboxylate transporter receptor subunit TctC
LAFAPLLTLSGEAGAADDYPSRPVRFIVPFPPGGGLDITARLVVPTLSEALGKPVVVDNRPGAGGTVGLGTTAKSTPDGHTMVMASASHVIQAILLKPGFDFFRDLAPVTEIIASPYLLVSHPGVPAKSVRELVAYAKAQAGKLVYASAGKGSLQHLSMELFLQGAGIDALHVPYKGMAPALTDVHAGRAHIMMSSLASLASHVQSKSVHALAITSSERSPILPDLPTMIESGFSGFVVEQWQGTLVPAGTPEAIIARLQAAIAKALHATEMTAYLRKSGAKAVGSTPGQFRAKLAAERSKWANVIAKAGLELN